MSSFPSSSASVKMSSFPSSSASVKMSSFPSSSASAHFQPQCPPSSSSSSQLIDTTELLRSAALALTESIWKNKQDQQQRQQQHRQQEEAVHDKLSPPAAEGADHIQHPFGGHGELLPPLTQKPALPLVDVRRPLVGEAGDDRCRKRRKRKSLPEATTTANNDKGKGGELSERDEAQIHQFVATLLRAERERKAAEDRREKTPWGKKQKH